MRFWASGVTVVATGDGVRCWGMTVSSFTSVSLEPPLILVCLAKNTQTCRMILEREVFSVSLLGAYQAQLSSQFAGFTDLPPGKDRFSGIEVFTARTEAPILREALAWLDCRLYQCYDGVSHQIIVGEVVAAGQQSEPGQPLVYHNRGYWKLMTQDAAQSS